MSMNRQNARMVFLRFGKVGRICSLALTVWLALPASHARAATYYVDVNNPSAADANNGSSTMPWKSMYALNGKALAAGDTVIVKTGLYSVPTGGAWDMPAINVGSSGTQSSPITIKSEQLYGAVLDGGGSAANAPIGSSDRSWIVWDGFEVRNTGPKGIAIFRSTGITVQNCKIHAVVQVAIPGDNTDGIRVEGSKNVTLRNNDISDIRSGSPNHWNGAGVKLYDNFDVMVENNRIHDIQGSAIFDKRGGNNNTYRNNLIENVYDALVLNTIAGYPSGTITFNNNVVRNVQNLSQTDETMDGGVYVFSNTYVNYAGMGVRVRSSNPAHRYYFYNNLMVRTGLLSGSYGDVVVVNPTLVGQRNYNVYPSSSPRFVAFQYLANETAYTSLAAWKAAFPAYDVASSSAAPVFVSAASGDYRLAAGSALKGSARVNGIATGAVIDPGAYSTGSEVIGLKAAANLAPQSPQSLRVQ